MKILVDTNIWISVFINMEFQFFIIRILENNIQIVSSVEQIEEISAVFAKPKLKKLINKSLLEEFLVLFIKTVEIVEPKVRINECRDKKDNYILETAISGKVNYIVTEDLDLLILDPFRDLRIMRVKEFFKLLSGNKIN